MRGRGSVLFIGKNLIVMITSAKPLHLPSLEIPFRPLELSGGKNAPNRHWKNAQFDGVTLFAAGMRAAADLRGCARPADRDKPLLIG